MKGLDDWITQGNWHYCEVCGTKWCDADGGCSCEPEETEEEEEDDEDEDDFEQGTPHDLDYHPRR